MILENCNIIMPKQNIVMPATIYIDGVTISNIDYTNKPLYINTNLSQKKIIDMQFTYVMPGLIDMHVHMCANSDRSALKVEKLYQSYPLMNINGTRNLQTALDCGITSIRDMGSHGKAPFDVKRQWYNNTVSGSRPFISGPMITSINGHGTEQGSKLGQEISGEIEIASLVRQLSKDGVDYIKLSLGGITTTNQLTLPEIKAAVKEAHSQSLKVACHAIANHQDVHSAILAKCDTIEHACFINKEDAKRIKEFGLYICPTIIALKTICDYNRIHNSNYTEFQRKICSILDRHRESFEVALKYDLSIVAGTDAGIQGVNFSMLHNELELLVEWGMSPNQAILSATECAAQALGRDDLGIIRPFAAADLVFLKDNPLKDIRSTRNIYKVMQSGIFVR